MSYKPDRELQPIPEMDKIRGILRNHLMGRSLFLKGSEPPAELRLIGFASEEKNIIVLDPGRIHIDPGEVILYQVLGRYIELHCKMIKRSDATGQIALQVNGAFIAKKQRGSIRIPIKGEEIWITNIRASTGTIELTTFNIPAKVKVNFNMFEQQIKKKADFVTVSVHTGKDPLIEAIRKDGRPLLLSDTTDEQSYQADSTRHFNFADYLGSGLKKKIEEYRIAKIISDLIYPIKLDTGVGIGYVRMQSRTRHFDRITLADLEKGISDLISKIRDSNQIFVQEKQKIINISRGGIKAVIDHPELKENLPKQKGFTFDLLFKMQAPITLYGLIRMAEEGPSGNLILGIQISGNSDREGEMRRFLDNVTQMEKAIHDRLELAKRIKNRKN